MQQEYNIRSDLYRAFVPLFVGAEQCDPNYAYGPALRPYWLIHFVISGKGKYRVGGKEFSLSAGQAFLIKPNEVSYYRADSIDPWHYVWVAFQSDHPALGGLPYLLHNERLAAVMTALCLRETLSPAAAAAAVWQVVHCICPQELPTDPKGYVATAKSIVHKRFMQALSVQQLAARLGLDRSYFSNLFKKETGLSPAQYLMHYRMKRAKEMLTEGYSVSIVAASVGYKDPFTFSRSFKNFYGCAPNQLKKQNPKS